MTRRHAPEEAEEPLPLFAHQDIDPHTGRLLPARCGGFVLFPPAARLTDPDTSHAAAEDAQENASTHRARALALLQSHPDGLTDFELADLTGLQQTSIGKRRGELRDRGLVRDSGRRRPAPSGSLAIVWVATQ